MNWHHYSHTVKGNRRCAAVHIGTKNAKNMAAFKQDLAVQVPLDLGDIAII
jgi:hypothetical protein